jgi:hypothetical protein
LSFILISKPRLTCLPIIAVRLQQLNYKPVFHFSISLAAPCSGGNIKNNISGSFLYNTLVLHYNIRASLSPGLGYILIYVRGESVGQSYSSVGHQFTRVGQRINLTFTLVGQNVRWFPLYTSDNLTNGSDNVRDRPIF